MYQKCPNCKGSGKTRVMNQTFEKCPSCKGEGIVSFTYNGKPVENSVIFKHLGL